MTKLNELFAELGTRMGIFVPKFDDRNMLALEIDSELYLFVAYEATVEGFDYTYLSVVRRLVEYPHTTAEQLALLKDIAEKNCFFQRTFGGAIGLRDAALYFTYSVPREEVGDEPALERCIDQVIRMCNGFVEDFKSLGANPLPVSENALEDYMNAYGNINLMV